MFGQQDRILTLQGYPFDQYSSDMFDVAGTYSNENGTIVPVNILVSLVGAIQSWSIQVPAILDKSVYRDGTHLIIDVEIARSMTTKV